MFLFNLIRSKARGNKRSMTAGCYFGGRALVVLHDVSARDGSNRTKVAIIMAHRVTRPAAAAALARRSSRAAVVALRAHAPCTPAAHHLPLHRSDVPAGARSVTNLLSVVGLPPRTEPEQVRELFEKFGDLEEVRAVGSTPPATSPTLAICTTHHHHHHHHATQSPLTTTTTTTVLPAR